MNQLVSISRSLTSSVLTDAKSYIQIAAGDPIDTLAHSHYPRVRSFLTRGQKGGASAGSNG